MPNCPYCGTQNLSDDHTYCFKCGYNVTGATGQLAPDTVLEGRYVIVETLGCGGMGAVYKALDQRLNNIPVAIKEMSTKAVGQGNLQSAIGAFKKEAAMLIGLRYPALPRIGDFFSQGEDRWYLVMDYIEGETLKEILERRGHIPESEVLDWARQICLILDYLHSQKPPVIFRDLKPANIMLTPEGIIKLIDFGIARHFRPGLTSDTTAYGSVGYAPPEQHGDKQTDARSDIYALGATLHHLLTGLDPGKSPFIFETPGSIVVVSPELETAIVKALALRPEERPGSVREVLNILPKGGDNPDKTETLISQESYWQKDQPVVQKKEKHFFSETNRGQTATVTMSKSFKEQRSGELTVLNVQEPTLHKTPFEVCSRLTENTECLKENCSSNDLFDKCNESQTLPVETHTKRQRGGLTKRIVIASVIGLVIVAIFAIKIILEQREIVNFKMYQAKIEEGIRLSNSGSYLKAENTFNEALKYQTNQKDVCYNLGRMYLRKNDPQKAISLLTDQLEKGIIKDDCQAFYILGSAYFELKDYEKAIWYFQKSIQSSPVPSRNQYEQSMRDLAVSYGRSGNYSAAEETLRALEKAKGGPDHVTSYILGELSLAKKKYSEAQQYFTTVLAGAPANIRYKISAARLLSILSAEAASVQDKERNMMQAVGILKEAEEIDPYNIQVLSDYGKYNFELGQIYQSSGNNSCFGQYQQALIIFNKIKDIGITSINTYLNLAIINDKLDRYNDADTAFQEALKIDKGDSHTNFVYGLFNLKHKNYEKAYKYLQYTVDLNKNSEEVSVARTKIRELREKGWI